MSEPPLECLSLASYGWERLASGRWFHPEHTVNGRRKLFSESDAIAELAAKTNPPPPSPWSRIV